MLARMGAAFDLAPMAPCSPDARLLKDLHVARAGLVKDRTRLCNRAKVQEIAVLKRQTKARLAQLERQIAELDTEIAALIGARESTAHSLDILCSMPGIGAVTAAAVLTLMPEIGTLERKQVASLTGLAPFNRQSGQSQGKACIGGGRKPLRDALYMPALVAIRSNPDLKVKYEHLRGRQTRQSRHHRNHAQAHRNGERVSQSRPEVDTKNRLIKTDTFGKK